MNKSVRIDGAILKSLLEYGYNSLLLNKKIVNELNVFPIPDGDTGENMCLTLSGGLSAVKGDSSEDLGAVAGACSQGMLSSARGNSGVILSQLFDGFAESVKDKKEIDVDGLSKALEGAVKKGYLAVDKPTEGTILTVARETAEAVREKDLKEKAIDATEFMKNLLEVVKKSVEETPDKLDKLKEAGVVDSGGAGLYYILEGCLKYLCGEQLERAENETAITDADYSKFNENSVLEYGYCSEVLLQLTKSKTDIDAFDVDALKEFLNSIGDSLVVVKTGYVVKIHVHTFEPYKLLEYCGRFGEFLKVKIENMTLQHSESTIKNNFEPKLLKREKKKYGIIVVASGDGVKEMFKELGADIVIDGGQTNNPPASDFIKAFNEVNAKTVFVFPNNANIILAAKQAAKNYGASNIYVVESKSVGEGYAGLSMIDLSGDDAEEILSNITAEMDNVLTGCITTATRDANINGVSIKKDEFVGICGKEIVCSQPTRTRATVDLLDKMGIEKGEYAVLIYGKNFTENEREFTGKYVADKNPGLETYEIDGGQEIYDLHIVLN